MPRWSGRPVSCSPSWALPWLWPCPPSGFPRCSAPSWCWSASAWSSSLTASGGEQECEVRLVTYSTSEGARVGMVDDDRVVDLTAAGFGDMVELIAAGRDASSGLSVGSLPSLPLGEVQLLAPLRPRKNVFAIGRNYAEHLGEVSGLKADAESIPENPIVFTKPPTAIIGPGAPIESSNDPLDTTDYEGELAVVIGPGGKGIPAEEAWDHVFGYTLVNDVTSRGLQRKHIQWFIGKAVDTFCPMGPWIVTADEIDDVTRLELRTEVNGELRQRGSVADLIFDIPTLIATLSEVITLEPGDVIATGTPAGVGAGFDPPRYLRPGDTVSITVDEIGTLTNPVACKSGTQPSADARPRPRHARKAGRRSRRPDVEAAAMI